MPIYDYKCDSCGHEFEAIAKIDERVTQCPVCGVETNHRLCTCTGGNASNEDVPWIRTVREVVDKEGGAHCQEFLKDPTRSNFKNWQKKEGVRFLEPGEENPSKWKKKREEKIAQTHKHLTKKCVDGLRKRRSINVQG